MEDSSFRIEKRMEGRGNTVYRENTRIKRRGKRFKRRERLRNISEKYETNDHYSEHENTYVFNDMSEQVEYGLTWEEWEDEWSLPCTEEEWDWYHEEAMYRRMGEILFQESSINVKKAIHSHLIK